MKELADVQHEPRISRDTQTALIERELRVSIGECPGVAALGLTLSKNEDSAPRLDRAPQLRSEHIAGSSMISRQQVGARIGRPSFGVDDALQQQSALRARAHRQARQGAR